ncbi:unnamed protein product [Clavelina lepadiformis]|uniref:Uncharacterized protein n=1 Tax=Clavelina lepadiformis TaxID=159417 RepID=A0ABP0GB63_CLALP
MKKKPSSAKRSIQLQAFSPHVSSKRLNCVQDLLISDGSDTILLILGIDSRYNEGCRELANYLLFGFYDLRLSQLEESGIPEEDLDDVVILIRATSVAVYCSGVLYSYLLPYIAHWRNLEVHCWPDLDQKDKDDHQEEKEEFKIRSFVAMVSSSTHIGIPYWATRSLGIAHHLQSPSNFDKFAIEKWPLVQSYALEGMGGGGFFTMRFEVSNVRNQLLSIYEQCDPADLEQILIKSLPLFERHWREAISTVSGTSDFEKAKMADMEVTAKQVLEPLRSYYSHGRLSTLSSQQELDQSRQPFVQFGKQTLEKTSLLDSTLRDSGVNGSALHMVIRSAAPRRPISCTRTYFIQPDTQRSDIMRDFELLVGLYTACVDACHSAIWQYCKNFSETDARSAAQRVVASACAHLPHSGAHEFTVEVYNNSAKLVTLKSDNMSCYIKKITVSITSIKSTSGEGILGNVSYSDTFIDSHIQAMNDEVLENGDAMSKHWKHIILTAGVPKYVEWKTSRDCDNALDENLVVKCDSVFICSSSSLVDPKAECLLKLYGDGSVVLVPINAPPFTIKASSIGSYLYYDTGLPNAVQLLQLKLRQDDILPKYLRPIHRTSLALAFFPQSSASKALISKAIPYLERLSTKGEHLKFESIGRFDESLIRSYDEVQSNYMWHAGISHRSGSEARSSNLTKSTYSLQPQLTDFMKHFGVSFVTGGEAIPAPDASLMVDDKGLLNEISPKEKTDKVCVSIVAGIPGCHGDRLCSSLIALNRERVRWVVVKVKSKDGDAAATDVDHLQRQLTEFVSKRRATRPGAAASKRLRIIVEVTGFFDIADVVSSILNHRDPSTRGRMYIGAVTVCIDPLSCFVEHKRILPKVLEQCAAGLATCVAFTGTHEDIKDESLASMQTLIRLVNPGAAFMLASKGRTSRTGDFDLVLSEDSFQAPTNVITRHLAMPGLWNGSYVTGSSSIKIQDVVLEFSQPLLKGSFSARLRALKHAMTGHPYTGNVYMVQGVLAFTGERSFKTFR